MGDKLSPTPLTCGFRCGKLENVAAGLRDILSPNALTCCFDGGKLARTILTQRYCLRKNNARIHFGALLFDLSNGVERALDRGES